MLARLLFLLFVCAAIAACSGNHNLHSIVDYSFTTLKRDHENETEKIKPNGKQTQRDDQTATKGAATDL